MKNSENAKMINSKSMIIDCVIILLLTICFLYLVFNNIGNSIMPFTNNEFGINKNPSVVVEFNEPVQISAIDFFLGNIGNRSVAIYSYDENNDSWIQIGDVGILEYVFRWSRIESDFQSKQIGIIFLDEQAIINEIVFLTNDNQIITPINVNTYPELFDEQEKHPTYNSYFYGSIFDEIYHVRAAYEINSGIPAIKTNHPYLGNEIIGLGIKIFGMNPYGWRFFPAMFGALMIPVFYIFLRKISNDILTAFIGTFIFVFDFMHLSLSRLGTVDTVVAALILLMYLFMFIFFQKNKAKSRYSIVFFALSGLFMGLGIATKYTAAFAGLGLGILFSIYFIKYIEKENRIKMIFAGLVFFVLIPALIYIISFIPVIEESSSGKLILKTINESSKILNYHFTLDENHVNSSRWYQWLINSKLMLSSKDYIENGQLCTTIIYGNPVVVLCVIPCFIFNIYLIIKNKDKKAFLIVFMYLVQLVPWMLVNRITFIYSYFPALTFGIMMIAYSIYVLKQKSIYLKYISYIYMAVVLSVFLLGYQSVAGTALY